MLHPVLLVELLLRFPLVTCTGLGPWTIHPLEDYNCMLLSKTENLYHKDIDEDVALVVPFLDLCVKVDDLSWVLTKENGA